jgi:hypothetical protein
MRFFGKGVQPPPSALSGAGYAVCNGHRLSISKIGFSQGGVEVTVNAWGPCVMDGPITVFGADDLGVWQAFDVPRREIPAGSIMSIEVHMHIEQVTESKQFTWRN